MDLPTCCLLENHLCVEGTTAVLWRRVTAAIRSQRVRVSGFLAQIWRFHWNDSCPAADQHQLLFLEEDTQVRRDGSSSI